MTELGQPRWFLPMAWPDQWRALGLQAPAQA
jgi:hypothetical protein